MRKTKKVHAPHKRLYVYNDFMRFLCEKEPALLSQPFHTRVGIAKMVYDANSAARSHKTHVGAFHYGHQEMDRLFGRGGFRKINEALSICCVEESWSKTEGLRKPLYLNEKYRGIRDEFLRMRSSRRVSPPAEIIFSDQSLMRKPPKNAIESKDANGHTKKGWSHGEVISTVPINSAALARLIEEVARKKQGAIQLDFFDGPDLNLLERIEQDARVFIHQANNNVANGCVIQRYTQHPSGRLYSSREQGHSLQNCTGVVRNAAMKGLFDYDIENCHFSILDQMASAAGYECGPVRDYLANKHGIRSAISGQVGITEKQAKTVLIALIYGATQTVSHDGAFMKTLDADEEKTRRLYGNHTFKRLSRDVVKARSAILKRATVVNGGVVNVWGKSLPIDGSKPRQRLAHILQGIEAKALEAAHRCAPDDIVLLVHDGFVSRERLNIETLEMAIKESTGFVLKVALKGELRPDLDA